MYGLENSIPHDWNAPNFDDKHKCHEWKRYASKDIIHYWPDMPDEHKQIISALLQDFADQEEWD